MRYNSFLHIFPEQCAKYLHDKFRMHSELTVRELMVILKHIGIKTVKIHNNGKIYDVFSKRDIDGIQDFEFLNNLHEYRRIKQIRDEWSKESLIDYNPELSDMQNASDELLRQDDVYYINENKNNKNNMKQDNKKLYENIMASVAKEVKKALNENKEDYSIAKQLFDKTTEIFQKEELTEFDFLELKVVYSQMYRHSQTYFYSYAPLGQAAETNYKGRKADSVDKILKLPNKCFEGNVIYDQETIDNELHKCWELEENGQNMVSYILLVKHARKKIDQKYYFFVKLNEFGNNSILKLFDKPQLNKIENKMTAFCNDCGKKFNLNEQEIYYIKKTTATFINDITSDDIELENNDWDITRYNRNMPGKFNNFGFNYHNNNMIDILDNIINDKQKFTQFKNIFKCLAESYNELKNK